MNRQFSIRSLALVSFWAASISCGLLTACNTGTSNNNTTSPTATSSPQASEPATPKASTTGNSTNPVSANLPGGERQNTDPLQLMVTPQFRQELKLTDAQVAEIKKLDAEFRKDLNQIAEQEKGKKDLKAEDVDRYNKLFDQKVQESRAKVGKILKPEQLERMKQISLQIFGFGVFTYNDYADQLKLTDKQQSDLQKLRDELPAKIQANWKTPSDDPNKRSQDLADNRSRVEQLIKNSNEQALSLLTPEQQKTLETLKGPKFDFDANTAVQ